ncbi:MAG: hypothetical protein IT330_00125 [Anaerolineae bacterium]|nr:hypothetical protein [Anaerolineae bacterium]
MALYIGLDAGTTTLSTVVLDAESGLLLARRTVIHTASATTPGEKASGRAELDLNGLRSLMVKVLADVTSQIASRASEIGGIGVTGQMHGVAFLQPDAPPVRPAITWEDRRADERLPGSHETYLERFISLAGGPEAFARTGCLPATGYLGPTLFWLRHHDRLPPPPARVCFIPDAVVSFLTGLPPCTDPTDGGSSGIFDIVARAWDWPLIARLGLPEEIFPAVREPGERAGSLLAAIAAQTGLPPETPVFVALGDNQASFLGSVHEPVQALSLTVGTGSQVSALVGKFQRLPGLDTRYFPGGRYLLVGAGLFGGRSYAYLRDFFRQVGATFFGGRGDEELYDEMTRLAAQVSPGCEGLRCTPTFTGTRLDPALRASFTGLAPRNFTPGHLTRALLEGMAEGFHQFHEQMQPLAGPRTHLVGSGNGLRRNRLLAEMVGQRFGLPLYFPALEEEAATGAALTAAVGAGEVAGWDAAAALLRYQVS